MTVRVSDLMATAVVVAQPDHTIEYIRRQMQTLEIHAVPVADADGRPVGIVHSRNLLDGKPDDTPATDAMDREVLSVELGTDVKMAAKMMRQHRRNHLIVTDAGAIAGILSSFDFLKLVETATFEDDEQSAFKTGVFYVPKDEERS